MTKDEAIEAAARIFRAINDQEKFGKEDSHQKFLRQCSNEIWSWFIAVYKGTGKIQCE